MSKTYAMCPKCGRITEASVESGFLGLGKKYTKCCECGAQGAEVTSVIPRECSKCGSILYGCDERQFCPNCGHVENEQEECRNELVEGIDNTRTADIDYHCPTCRGPLVQNYGVYICPNCRVAVDKKEIESQKLHKEAIDQNNSARVIDWPYRDMQRSGRLILFHGYGDHIPPHSTILVCDHQIVLYTCAGKTYMKGQGHYEFFYDMRTEEEKLHSLYSDAEEYAFEPIIGTSITFVSLLQCKSTYASDAINLYGTQYRYEPGLDYLTQIVDPQTLLGNQLDLERIQETIKDWCEGAIRDALRVRLDGYFSGNYDFTGNGIEAIELHIRKKFHEDKKDIVDDINRTLGNHYGIKIVIPNDIKTEQCVSSENYVGCCHKRGCNGGLTFDPSKNCTICSVDARHKFFWCTKCEQFTVPSGEHRCISCGTYNVTS